MARRNYCTNPSCEVGAGGLATDFFKNESITGTSVVTQVSALGSVGQYAQRYEYTGVAGDAAGTLMAGLGFKAANCAPFAAGDPVSASFLLKGSITGVSLRFMLYSSGWGGICNSGYITPGASPLRYTCTGTCPAGTTYVRPYWEVTGVGPGDAVDFTIDDFLLEKAAASYSYFDGSFKGRWSGAANASQSNFIADAATNLLMMGAAA